MKHIPNILTVFRLLLVPLFVVLFFLVAPIAALPISWLAAITDVFDGYLARRNGWITPLGKVLDPVADKLMQGALLVSLAVGGLFPWYLGIPFVLKELAQGVCGFLMFRRRSVLVVSHWYGKVALTLFHLAVNFTVVLNAFLDPLPTAAAVCLAVLWIAALGLMIYAFVSYIVSYAKMAAKMKKEWREAPRGARD